jgi:hypothetical protein
MLSGLSMATTCSPPSHDALGVEHAPHLVGLEVRRLFVADSTGTAALREAVQRRAAELPRPGRVVVGTGAAQGAVVVCADEHDPLAARPPHLDSEVLHGNAVDPWPSRVTA